MLSSLTFASWQIPLPKTFFGDDLGKKVKDFQDQQKAAAGVMKGARARPGSAYYPYRNYGDAARRQVRAAGWTQTHNPGPSNRPFLGGPRKPWNQRSSSQG